MLILIDADPIVYRCGFASERTSWHLVYENQIGDVCEVVFNPDDEETAGAKMSAWMAARKDQITVLDKSRVVHPDPVSYALRATKVQIESIITECEQHFKEPGKMLMWISGAGGTYRDKIATVRPYKGNRDPTHKPYHYDAIRDYVRERYRSFVTNRIEADDAVSIFAHQHYEAGGQESLVICTIDKDLDQIPGNHYNYMNKVFYAITPNEANRWFIYQILAGDITDNIVGVWKCGDSRARSILADIDRNAGGHPLGKRSSRTTADASHDTGDTSSANQSPPCGIVSTNTTTSAESEESIRGELGGNSHDWWPTIVQQFADSQRLASCPYAGSDPEAVALEMAQLVKLQEYPGQLWHPYGDLVVPGFGDEDFDS